MLPPNAMLYRLDGDEFGILLLEGDAKEAARIYGKLQQNFCRQQEYGEGNISVPCRRGMLVILRMGVIIWSSLRAPTILWNTPK